MSAERDQAAPVDRIEDAALERAARALRHAAHVYHTASDERKDAARAALEQAAVEFVLAKLKASLA